MISVVLLARQLAEYCRDVADTNISVSCLEMFLKMRILEISRFVNECSSDRLYFYVDDSDNIYITCRDKALHVANLRHIEHICEKLENNNIELATIEDTSRYVPVTSTESIVREDAQQIENTVEKVVEDEYEEVKERYLGQEKVRRSILSEY